MPTLLATFTGPDSPGVSVTVFDVLAAAEATVLDVEQQVLRGQLKLDVLIACPGEAPEAGTEGVAAQLQRAGARLGMSTSVTLGQGDNVQRPSGRVVVVVVGAPLTARSLGAVFHEIAAQGANVDRMRRLARRPVTAIELDVSGAQVDSLRPALSGAAAEHGVDVAVAPAGLARHGRLLVVMDVDSTLIQDEVIELLAAHAGREEEVAAVTQRAMRGELDFAESLRERVATLAGLEVSVLADVRHAVRLTPGARTLVRTLRRFGHSVALVSGGFAEIVEPLAAELGIEHVHANRLAVADGRLTGEVAGPIVDRAGKAAALRRFAELEGVPLERTVAVGDGANDLDMLATAGLGVAFNAKPLVQQQADAAVNVPYLDAVLALIGIDSDAVDAARA